MLIFWAVLGGFLLDAVFGDPVWLLHPVVLMGRCITAVSYTHLDVYKRQPRNGLRHCAQHRP